MLGSVRFAADAPSVVDPGDFPPSTHLQSDCSGGTHSTAFSDSDSASSSSSHDNSEDDKALFEYQQARTSRARLLNDISDIELFPKQETIKLAPPRSRDMRSCRALADDVGLQGGGNSLPSVESARTYAATLLVKSAHRSVDKSTLVTSTSSTPTSMVNNTSLPLVFNDGDKISFSGSSSSTPRRLVRKQITRWAILRGIPLVCVIFAFVILMVALVDTKNQQTKQVIIDNDDHGDSTAYTISARHAESRNFLAANGISTEEDLIRHGSPQQIACNWISDLDALQYEIPMSSIAPEDQRDVVVPFLQRYILAAFFFATGGPEWTHTLNFMSSLHECAWEHAKSVHGFIQTETSMGVSCDVDLHVTQLFVPLNNLTGSIPSEIQHLSHLRMISLADNKLTGRLPEGLDRLRELVYFDFQYNDLTGAIPEWIGELQNLEVLGLSNNRFVGAVPASVGGLSRLKTLALDDNEFHGSLDFAERLTNLEYFYVDRNFFAHKVDSSFLAELSRLRELDLSSNLLTGTEFPEHFFSGRTLHVLDLADNEIAGTLPDYIEQNDALQFFSVHGNALFGTVPPALQNLRVLAHLDLQANHFSGDLPNEMGHLSGLTYLFAGYNAFFPLEDFPPFLSQLVELRELALPSIQLKGHIPGWLATDLPQLQLLDLSANDMTGSIPEALWNMEHLDYLFLDHNQLTGSLPQVAEFTDGEPTLSLKVLMLHKNKSVSGDADALCKASPDIVHMGIDCSANLTCNSEDCCVACCPENDDDCYRDIIDQYMTSVEGMWEFGYDRAPFAFDPDVLDETGLFKVIEKEPPQSP